VSKKDGMSKRQLMATWTCFMLTAACKRYKLPRDEFVRIVQKYGVASILL
jgi:3-oxoacyl-[acyl-carrier-protein] synthase III